MPCPLSRNTCPFCVVGGIFSRSDFPLSVLTSTSPPSTAVVSGTDAWTRFLRRRRATEERVEEVGEWIALAEHLAHLLFGHRPEATALAAAEVDVPFAAAREARSGARARTGLLVHAPVGAELIVFLALLRVAKDLVGLVELLESSLGRLVAGVDVGMVLARQLPERGFD